MICLSHFPCSGIGWCIRRRSSSLMSRGFARMRSRRVFRLSWKAPRRDFPQMNVNPKKHKGLRFIETLSLALRRGMATKLNQPGLIRMERQRELLKSCSHRIEEATCLVLVLEANDQIVGVSHDDHLALGLAPSPAVSPEIKAVVQVDIGKKR